MYPIAFDKNDNMPLYTSSEVVSHNIDEKSVQPLPIFFDDASHNGYLCYKYIQLASQTAGKAKHKYKGRSYVVRTGSRGGKYILVQGKKLYI
jgi:hypothetical protein